jgi:DNA polymerase I-like protein with 3'-5' exonuclease and polymerase domains
MSFRLLYGGSAYAFYMDPLMPDFSLKRWTEIVNQYNAKYWQLVQWQNNNIRDVGKQKGWHFGQLGRIYKIPQVVDGKWAGVMKYSETCIKNYEVQGTATGDIVPIAMNNIDYRAFILRSQFENCKWMGQVHDSVLFDVDYKEDIVPLAKICIDVFEDLPRLVSKMFDVDFNLPLTGEAEAGKNYGNLTWSMKKENGLWVTEGEL